MTRTKHFFSCDWGTTNFRLALLDTETGRVLASTRAGEGTLTLSKASSRADAFRSFLAEHVETLTRETGTSPTSPVWISGMASSSIGWRELPYATLPFRLDGSGALVEPVENLGDANSHPVHLVSGLRSGRDVMRGEETQLIGLADDIDISGEDDYVVLLPGTHSKFVDIQRGTIVGFETAMTGELFDLLRSHSILRHSTSPKKVDLGSEQRDAFVLGVRDSERASLAASLFRVRTREVLDGCERENNTAYLSGLLIGSELHGAAWLSHSERRIILAGEGSLATAYHLALSELGMTVETQSIEQSVAMGHRKLMFIRTM